MGGKPQENKRLTRRRIFHTHRCEAPLSKHPVPSTTKAEKCICGWLGRPKAEKGIHGWADQRPKSAGAVGPTKGPLVGPTAHALFGLVGPTVYALFCLWSAQPTAYTLFGFGRGGDGGFREGWREEQGGGRACGPKKLKSAYAVGWADQRPKSAHTVGRTRGRRVHERLGRPKDLWSAQPLMHSSASGRPNRVCPFRPLVGPTNRVRTFRFWS